MTNKKAFSFFTTCSVLLFLLIVSTVLHAEPMASAIYSETDLGSGFWGYDFTLWNDSDPVSDYADIYDFFLHIDPASNLSAVTSTDWDVFYASDFIDWISPIPGAMPAGTDIAPGEFLSGFSFTSDTRLPSFAFETYLMNPSGDVFIYGGLASLAANPVPEPGTLALLGGGLLALVFSARKFRK